MRSSDIKVEVKVNKKTGQYKVTILDHGQQISCADLDTNGENLNCKIVKMISEGLSGISEDPSLTRQGEVECRQASSKKVPISSNEEEGEEVESKQKSKNKNVGL